MSIERKVFLGTDCGATTSKVGAVWEDGTMVSTQLRQRPTNSQLGPAAVTASWVAAEEDFLAEHGLSWSSVAGVGLAIPGPYQKYGVLDRTANLPSSFTGWDVQADYSRALSEKAGRPVPLMVGNDGKLGGVAEARHARGAMATSVLMLAPGSGLGCAFVDQHGLPLEGETLAGIEGGHVPAPLHLLKMKPLPCGCGRDWGCIEAYTTISGLPYLLEAKLEEYPEHPLAKLASPVKEKALSLRGLAQKGDALAVEIFDFQARALGLHAANLITLFDPGILVIGGGLMDPESTTVEFRTRYLRIVEETARPYLWPMQRAHLRVAPAALGELSQAIGAALMARYRQGS